MLHASRRPLAWLIFDVGQNMSTWSLQEGTASLELSCESDGAGDYLAALEVRVDGFSGHADGHVVGGEWDGFANDLRSLAQTCKGEARFESAIAGEFELRVHSIDSLGHMGVSGLLRYRRVGVEDWPQQQFRFAFEFDPSKLSAFARCIAISR